MNTSGSDSNLPAYSRIGLAGVPLDFNSSYLRGAAKAPPRIREALYSDSSNLFCENGLNLGDPPVYFDCGDVQISRQDYLAKIEQRTLEITEWPLLPFFIGGDHSITYPIIRGMSRRHSSLTILQFDAHPDLYKEFEGSSLSHACPFARIMEEGLVESLIQVGVRCMTKDQQEQADRFGVRTLHMKEMDNGLSAELRTPLYISFDLDVLDPAFAPGVSHHEPGGFSVRQAIDIVQGLNVPVIGADLVEYNPDRDTFGMTAMAAAKILKEISAKMLETA